MTRLKQESMTKTECHKPGFLFADVRGLGHGGTHGEVSLSVGPL